MQNHQFKNNPQSVQHHAESKPTSLSPPPPSPKRPRLSTNSTPDIQYVGTTHEQLCADIDLSLPPDEWKLAAIQILGAYIGVSVHYNLSSPARVRRVRCGEIAPHIVTVSWVMETVSSGQSQKRSLEQKKTTLPFISPHWGICVRAPL